MSRSWPALRGRPTPAAVLRLPGGSAPHLRFSADLEFLRGRIQIFGNFQHGEVLVDSPSQHRKAAPMGFEFYGHFRIFAARHSHALRPKRFLSQRENALSPENP